MDAKITKQRISRMLSYDWALILGTIVGVIILWSLIFTMTATRILPTQQFTIFSYYCNAGLDTNYYARQQLLVSGSDKIFSQEVIEINTYDLASTKDMYSTMLQTRISTNEGDLIFLPKVTDKSISVKDGEEVKYPFTYVETFFASYASSCFEVEKYLTDMSAWLDTWYDGGHANGVLQEDAVRRDFIDRVTKNKDKRYKTNKQKQEGATLEVERIRKYKSAYDTVMKALQDGVIRYENVQLKDDKTDQVVYNGNYALNLCPDAQTMGKLKEWYAHNVAEENEPVELSAKDMCVMFFDMAKVDDSYEYESLVYVAHLIDACYTAPNA